MYQIVSVQQLVAFYLSTRFPNAKAIRKHQGPVVRTVDNFMQRINPFPADKLGAFVILIGQRANFIHWIEILSAG